jgi:hypothetical protein
MHLSIADAMQAKFPSVPFKFNVLPGETGPDIEVPSRYVNTVGFPYGEIKPVGPSGEAAFNGQVQNWVGNGTIPSNSSVQLITYDANGNVNLSYTNVPK